MSPTIAIGQNQLNEQARWIAGMRLATDGQRLSAALLQVHGTGLAVQPQLAATETAVMSDSFTRAWAHLASGVAVSGGSISTEVGLPDLWALSKELANSQIELVAQLLARHKQATLNLLAVGLADPGMWLMDNRCPLAYHALSDPMRFAELTGFNVVSAFAARDLQSGGLGGPVEALPLWILLRDTRRNRLLIDLGGTTRVLWLPRYQDAHVPPDLVALETGPGTRLLDRLTDYLTGGTLSQDSGGRLAVQGQLVPELLERLLAECDHSAPPPCWHPYGRPVEPDLRVVMQHRGTASTGDLLCTVTHFVAGSVAQALQRYVPGAAQADQIFLCGGGQQNGLLLQALQQRLPQAPWKRLEDVGLATEALDASSIAVLTCLCLDQTPGNLPAVTGAEVSRVLGQITPGSPRNWHRLLRRAGLIAAQMPLRSAA